MALFYANDNKLSGNINYSGEKKPSDTSIKNHRWILFYALRFVYGGLRPKDVNKILDDPVGLAFDSVFKALNNVYDYTREPILSILSKCAVLGSDLGNCIPILDESLNRSPGLMNVLENYDPDFVLRIPPY